VTNPELTLAEQIRQMREALEDLCPWVWGEGTSANGGSKQVRRLLNGEEVPQKAFAALALTPSQAEQQAKANAEKAALLDEAHKHLVFALTLIRQCRTPSSPDWQADYATLLAFVFDLGEELEDKATKEATNA